MLGHLWTVYHSIMIHCHCAFSLEISLNLPFGQPLFDEIISKLSKFKQSWKYIQSISLVTSSNAKHWGWFSTKSVSLWILKENSLIPHRKPRMIVGLFQLSFS